MRKQSVKADNFEFDKNENLSLRPLPYNTLENDMSDNGGDTGDSLSLSESILELKNGRRILLKYSGLPIYENLGSKFDYQSNEHRNLTFIDYES